MAGKTRSRTPNRGAADQRSSLKSILEARIETLEVALKRAVAAENYASAFGLTNEIWGLRWAITQIVESPKRASKRKGGLGRK